jgi:nucleoside phosphorylase
MLALLAALPWEVSDVRRRMIVEVEGRNNDLPYWKGKLAGADVLLAVTGMGPGVAARSAQFMLEKFRPRLMVSFGVCGALTDDLRVGEMVLCRRVASEGAVALHSDSELSELACAALEELGLSWREGSSLTVDHVIRTPEEREELHVREHADVVEMESHAVLSEAQKKGVSHVTLRSVSDPPESVLPDVTKFMRGQRVVVGKLALYTLRHPRQVWELWKLYRATTAASKRFAALFEVVAPRLEAEGVSIGA